MSEKSYGSGDISTLITDIAARKRAFGRAIGHRDVSAEAPRDVFLSVCAAIAKNFEPIGYKYAKSGPHMSKRVGDFKAEVSFWSSNYNPAHQFFHVLLRKKHLTEGAVFLAPPFSGPLIY